MKENNHSNKMHAGGEFLKTMAESARAMMRQNLSQAEHLFKQMPPEKQQLFRDELKDAKAGKLDMAKLQQVITKMAK